VPFSQHTRRAVGAALLELRRQIMLTATQTAGVGEVVEALK
jgi:hypothetical protein